jgi:alpha-L-arabinofuranosidase
VSLVTLNVGETISFLTKLDGIPCATEIDVYTVTGPTVASITTAENTEVGIKESQWVAQFL